MAEGGFLKNQDQHLLECPICLEQLQQPKSLPCLHTFCLDCLGTYIKKELSGKRASETYFSCPICREMTHPVNQAEAKDNWAQQFPTNGLIQELAQLKMKSTEPFYCKPCKTNENIDTPAKFWCKTMDVLFCDLCKSSLHDKLHEDCSIADITDGGCRTPRQNQETPQCGKHNEKIDCYCKDHQLIGCNKCVFLDHRRCEDVTTTAEYFEKLKEGSDLEKTKKTLLKGAKVMLKLVKEFGEELDNLVKNQDMALQSITDLRKRLDNRLDKLQKDITDDLIRSVKEEKNLIQNSMSLCQRLTTAMQSTMMLSSKAVERNDDIEAILLHQRGQMEEMTCRDLVKVLKKSFTSVSIKHEVDPSIASINNAFGKVVILKQPKPFPDMLGFVATPLGGRIAKELVKFNITWLSDATTSSAAHGIVYLPDNHIVVSDYNNMKLKLFKDNGQYLNELKIKGHPYDMCLIDSNTVAVTTVKPGAMVVVSVKSSKISILRVTNMAFGAGYVGITYTGERFVLSMEGGNLCTFGNDGTSARLHRYNSPCYHLAHDPRKGQILVSHSSKSGVAVSSLTTDRRNKSLLNAGIVTDPSGIDVDNEGNIYVCGEASNNVLQMSSDGTNVRELLTLWDGVTRPQAISVCGDKFVITHISAFQVEIRVFQLV
ncbi:probable E3 ubiquitin-protein ligase MID2 [Mizuhopecten yessoensis]|uniref:Tripartite motif-containing protein 3 n=1 Tax=Mizuhopecten yessoensis TaxID=6573 RepID=A0A210Q184_MIZYE|nr:probable E3 ubiquitin-protein ligase MID2 [Mizuhopecten yessoensis]XP_021369889.1 probable E3 ubiquitin-protein ligase MID2 [Mizuhopecten yessoensis]OWF42513.1 Tripartite motif-containing protein 3 [Mizuhopecten yessoensis]